MYTFVLSILIIRKLNDIKTVFITINLKILLKVYLRLSVFSIFPLETACFFFLLAFLSPYNI